MPRFSFFTSHSQKPVTKDSPLWLQSIPLRLDALLKTDDVPVSHADYFQAAQTFLENRSCEMMTRAASQRLGRNLKPQDISEIQIRLQKHGAYYHPARVEVIADQRPLTFVLNVALSESGQHFVEGDYHHIKRLNAETPFDYLPQVYGWERIAGKTGLNFGMFLGEWFDGYHEFHLTADSSDNTLKIIVWDEILGRYFLTPAQIQTLYAKAAKILTCYYNPVSFEQILAWHHAAGDFIVNIDDSGLRLRLVSVRRYAAIFENQQTAPEDAGDPQILLQALLVFFLNLSIQMRLDRLEGVGEMVWSDNSAVEATLTGFLEALAIKPDPDTLPDSLLACFVAYLAACKSSDLFELSAVLISRFNPGMPELPVIQRNLGEHVDTLYGAIQDILAAFK